MLGSDGETKRLPGERPTLLVIVDDLELSMHEPGGDFMVIRALYACPSAPVIRAGFSSISALTDSPR